MTSPQLTGPAKAATFPGKGDASLQQRNRLGRRALLALPVWGLMALGACVSVKAPDKPIVIELNINIKQEVVYRLSADAGQTIEKNPEIF